MPMPAKPDGSKRVHRSHNHVYMLIKVDGKWIEEHRHVMEKVLGRKLLPSEHVHHKDEDTLNNEPTNLEIKTPQAHKEHHKPERARMKPMTECKHCGRLIYYSKGKVYCSPKCKFYATHVTRTCPVCGMKFIAYRSQVKRCCSRACGALYRRCQTG